MHNEHSRAPGANGRTRQARSQLSKNPPPPRSHTQPSRCPGRLLAPRRVPPMLMLSLYVAVTTTESAAGRGPLRRCIPPALIVVLWRLAGARASRRNRHRRLRAVPVGHSCCIAALRRRRRQRQRPLRRSASPRACGWLAVCAAVHLGRRWSLPPPVMPPGPATGRVSRRSGGAELRGKATGAKAEA